jgi:hypothetical protein
MGVILMITELSNNYEVEEKKEAKTDFRESDKNEKVIKKVEKLFKKAKEHRSGYDQHWLEYYKFFRGRQWKNDRPSYRHSEVINLVFQTIQSQVAIQTDKRPKVDYSAIEPRDFEFAQIMSKLIDADWVRNNWNDVITEVLYDAHFYGTCPASMLYNPDAENGLGKIEFESEDIFYFFPDPNAVDVNKKCQYVVIAEPMDIELIREKWPKGKHVNCDVSEDHNDRTNLEAIRLRNPTENVVAYEQSKPSEPNRQQALVVTCYLVDNEFNEEKSQNEKGDTVFKQVKKYPKGRKIVYANNVLLEDRPNEYNDGKIPYARLVNYMLPREFWGISEVENLKGPQQTFNKLVSFALDVLTLMGNPIWLVDTASGVDVDHLTNRPGAIIPKNPGTEVQRVEGVQLQPYVLQMIDRMQTWFDGISGANDITRGVRPEGVSAALAIQELQDAAQTRLRQKSRHMDSFIQNIGQMYLSRALQYYTIPRVVKLTGDENANKYFKFFVEPDRNEQGQYIVRVRDMEINEDGSMIEGEEKVYQTQGLLDVRVDTGSTLPFSKIERESRAYGLYDRGLIAPNTVFDMIDLPNKEKALQELQQFQQAQQAAAGQPAQA